MGNARMRTPVLYLLIAVNAIVYFGLQQIEWPPLELMPLWPVGKGFESWQLITYAFLHGSVLHIGMNMFGLWMFGLDLEEDWGSIRFLSYYLFCVVSAGLTQLAFAAWTGTDAPTVGASGGVFGILLAFALRYPERRVLLLIPPIPMPARVFVVLYAAVELFLGVTGTQAGVAHFAHLGGMLGGLIYLSIVGR